jgi:hypothetical protein
MELRDVGSGRNRNARFPLVASVQVVLRQSLSDLPGSDGNDRVLVGFVARIAIEYSDA